MGKRNEVSLRLRGERAVRPRLLLVELVFVDVISLLDLPAQKIEQGDQAWAQHWIGGDENKALLGGRVTIYNPAPIGISVPSHLIGLDATVDGIGAIKRVMADDGRLHVLLLPRNHRRLAQSPLLCPVEQIDIGGIGDDDGHQFAPILSEPAGPVALEDGELMPLDSIALKWSQGAQEA